MQRRFLILPVLFLIGGLVLTACHSGPRAMSLDARELRPPTDPAGHTRSLVLADTPTSDILPWYTARNDGGPVVIDPIDPGHVYQTTIITDRTAVSNGRVHNHYARTHILVRQRIR